MLISKFVKFLMLISKFVNCPHVNSKSVPLQILYHSSVSSMITSLYYFSSKYLYFAQKESIKVKVCGSCECPGQNLPNSSCQFWNGKSIPFQISYHSLVSSHTTLLQKIKLILFLLWIKESHQSPNFETLMCSGENLPYSSCHFPNYK